MARNSEKAMTALARWRRAKMEEEGTDKKTQRRPYLASECDNLQVNFIWRLDVNIYYLCHLISRIIVIDRTQNTPLEQ